MGRNQRNHQGPELRLRETTGTEPHEVLLGVSDVSEHPFLHPFCTDEKSPLWYRRGPTLSTPLPSERSEVGLHECGRRRSIVMEQELKGIPVRTLKNDAHLSSFLRTEWVSNHSKDSRYSRTLSEVKPDS